MILLAHILMARAEDGIIEKPTSRFNDRVDGAFELTGTNIQAGFLVEWLPDDLYYKWTAPADGVVTVDKISGSFLTVFHSHRPTLATNQSGFGEGANERPEPIVFAVKAGTEYLFYLQVRMPCPEVVLTLKFTPEKLPQRITNLLPDIFRGGRNIFRASQTGSGRIGLAVTNYEGDSASWFEATFPGPSQ